jgi:hypothetical protein
MSKERLEVQQEVEKENLDVFAETLKKVMETTAEKRGPAAKSIMAAFQVYYSQIGGSFAKAPEMDTY